MTNEESVKKCYESEEDSQALSCVKNVIANPEPGCKPRIVLLVREGCGGCAEEMARYKSDIDSGMLNVVDIFSEEGKAIARRNQIDMVPAILILDCQDQAIE